ncbi:hypothetical protein COS75_02405 [Candidatus Pacearchaeota archaeon CG06_land_8_20_14_3_00_35_12]|nr:MAG: hypothetical protein COS75_02405 [Candidatus Pacearchaeota archaeon CG06_land_8_20_14_3_00_35_12]
MRKNNHINLDTFEEKQGIREVGTPEAEFRVRYITNLGYGNITVTKLVLGKNIPSVEGKIISRTFIAAQDFYDTLNRLYRSELFI